MSRHRPLLTFASLVALGALAACGGESKSPDQTAPTAASPTAAAASGPIAPDPGGKIIIVQVTTDAEGSYFKPAQVQAKRGDVIRYTLKVGVHNVHFLPDSNAGRTGYPQAASDFLQLPGQTYDVAVKMPAGTYYFQCDPHAALGMKGHLVVQ
jgi:plastocyanin